MTGVRGGPFTTLTRSTLDSDRTPHASADLVSVGVHYTLSVCLFLSGTRMSYIFLKSDSYFYGLETDYLINKVSAREEMVSVRWLRDQINFDPFDPVKGLLQKRHLDIRLG